MTLTPISERLAVELSQPVLTTWVCRGWDSNTQSYACGANALINWDVKKSLNSSVDIARFIVSAQIRKVAKEPSFVIWTYVQKKLIYFLEYK